MAQIEIKNLTFKYAETEKNVLDAVSMEINREDFVLLCGKTGSGKSTLLRMMKEELAPKGELKGQIVFEDTLRSQEIGFVFQNPDHQIVTDKVWHELAFGMENLGYETGIIRQRVAEIAEYFGITNLYDRQVDQLSGGEKQILNLASVLTMEPKVLILDEPTAQLDPIAADNFVEMLRQIHEDFGTTIIISEHRLSRIVRYATKMVVLEEGKIIGKGKPGQVIKDTFDKMKRIMPVQCQVFLENNGEGEMPLTISQGRKWLRGVNVQRPSAKMSEYKKNNNDKAVVGKNIWFRYEKNSPDILRGLDIQVKKGEIFAILGGNGTGKTTTMKVLAGIKERYRGKLKINGKMSMLPQNVQTLFIKETVREELKDVSKETIELCQLELLMDKHPYDLSGGEQQKLPLAKVLDRDPDILLLDEPTKGIDGNYKEALGELLQKLKAKNKTIIIVSHDVDFCGQYADRCGLFAQGQLINVNNFRQFFCHNKYYTTTIRKMSFGVIDDAVNKEDINVI